MINAAERERAAAKAELDNLPELAGVTAASIYARIDSLPDVRAAVSKHAPPEKLRRLYDAVGLELRYAPDDKVVHVSTTLRVANECVRGGTRTRVPWKSPEFQEIS